MKTTELLYIDDFPRVVELVRMHVKEYDPDEPFEEQEILSTLFGIVNDTKRTERNAWVVWDGGIIVGYALAYAVQLPFNKRVETMLRYHYVQPESRLGGMAAFSLLHTYQNWAKLIGASLVSLGASRIDAPDLAKRINKMYEKRGFKLVGAIHQQRI